MSCRYFLIFAFLCPDLCSSPLQNNKNNGCLYVIGAGFAGRHLVSEPKIGDIYGKPIAFLDDDFTKIGHVIDGIPVLGPIADVIEIVKPANTVIIAIPGASNSFVKKLCEILKRAKFERIFIVPGIAPGISQVVDVETHLIQTRKIDPRDLLGRTPVKINLTESLAYLRNKRVLVTGAGGSIGSELCRQLLFGEVSTLFLLGQGENSIYHIDRELRILQKAGVGERTSLFPLIGDIKDEPYMDYIFGKLRIDVVFHAAAYKHVPLMEENPVAVIINNFFGTRNIIKTAQKHSVECFVHITTDKAVDPVSVYGVSKLLCEFLVLKLSESPENTLKSENRKGRCIAVRFGNVLGSRGSIVPLFQQQIERGGPVTVTHPDMRRWFMTIPEACSLVLQSGGVGENGNLYLLDMGKAILIRDIAEQMIKFYGLEPGKDIKIEYIGLRPGERLGERLWTDEEQPKKTPYNHILKVDRRNSTVVDIGMLIERIEPICFFNPQKNAIYRDAELLRKILVETIPTLNPSFHSVCESIGKC